MRAAAVVAVLALGLAATQTAAGKQPASRGERPLMLVVDISDSMNDLDTEKPNSKSRPKLDGAKLALLDYLGTVDPSQPVGLRTYPDASAGECNAGQRVIDVGPADPESMSATIRGLKADGGTPTAKALRAAANDLKAAGGTGGTIVIISDGESNCGADPCAVAKEIAGEGFDLDAITVGFRISPSGADELKCISNALDGRYLEIEKNEQLRDALDRLGRPQLEVAFDGGTRIEADAGGEPAQVRVRVTNTGQVEARDAIAGLTVKGAGIDVRRPITRLGNLAPQVSTTVTWSVRADAAAAGKSFPLTVVGRAVNASRAGEATGTLVANGVTRADQAGEILKGPGGKIAILGDSYSSGEGSDAYAWPTDTKDNGCHRSIKTYLMPAFGVPIERLAACSMALAINVLAPNQDNKLEQPDPQHRGRKALLPEPPQVAALQALQDREHAAARAVVLTIGGNDAGFGKLAASCLTGPESCTRAVYQSAPLPTDRIGSDDFLSQHVGDESGLAESLASVYYGVNRSLNNASAVARRGGRVAPILVPGYVLPVPLQGRTCAPMGTYTVAATFEGITVKHTFYLLTPGESDFVVKYALKLNAVVEAAVETARRERGIPVFYVPTTEFAFQPNHTVCDGEPFARATNSFNGGEWNASNIIALANPSPDRDSVANKIVAAKEVGERGIQELVHPNVSGYQAETQAILRWSRGRAAADAVAFTRTAGIAEEPAPTTWPASDAVLGPSSSDAGTLQPGTTYPLQAAGFAPSSETRIIVQSTPRVLGVPDADSAGGIDTRVAIPRDLAGGDHELRVVGRDPQGRPRTLTIRFSVDAPFRPGVLTSLLVGAAVLLLLGGVLAVATGQPARIRRRATRARTPV